MKNNSDRPRPDIEDRDVEKPAGTAAGDAQVGQEEFETRLRYRHRLGAFWRNMFRISTAVGIVVLVLLLLNIFNKAFGYVSFEPKVSPESLSINGIPLEDMNKEQLVAVFEGNVSAGLYRRFESEQPFEDRTTENVYALIQEWVVKPEVIEVYPLFVSIFQSKSIQAAVAQDPEHPEAYVEFYSWLDLQFITSPQEAEALRAGIRTAALGSLWTIFIAVLFAFPVGVSAAIYLEEYAGENWLNRIIRININNLAGVPSIIYGLLGLAIFVRLLVDITSGAFLTAGSSETANGRTILSAGLTLGLLVLPMVIINAQEAIKAVPGSLRQASLGLGATRWQTIWHHVLPGALPGIMTGTILAVSRAIGETAPLVVVGASTYINIDPDGPFSKFTTLPIQIYQWTSRPYDEFRSLAAAAIIVLLIMLLSLNAAAILLRNRYSKRV